MFLADYKTPTSKSRQTKVEKEKEFTEDDSRMCVIIYAYDSSAVKVLIGDEVAFSINSLSNDRLPDWYIGKFKVIGKAIVTEILRYNA